MKVSISLPEDDVRFLDLYAESQGIPSRSAALQRAIRLLRSHELGAAYEDAWSDWQSSEDADLWDQTTSDA